MKIHTSRDFLYTHNVNKIMYPAQDVFEFFNFDKTKKLGILVCHESGMPLRPGYEGSVLAVDFIEVFQKTKGIGTKMLKFAEEYSKQVGCKGYLTLKADSTFMPAKIPHIFYRKYGFSSFDYKTDMRLDKFIKKGINATSKDFPCLLMHYPPHPEEGLTSVQKILKFVKRFFLYNSKKIYL